MKVIPNEVRSAFMRHFVAERFDGLIRSLARDISYLPEEDTEMRVCVFHGYSKHGRNPDMHTVTDLLLDAYCTVSRPTLPYHGRSVPKGKDKERGQIKSFLRLVHTVHATTYKMLTVDSEKQLPVFLIGYSAGALAILRFLQEYPDVQKYLAGVILIGTPLSVTQNASEWVRKHEKALDPVLDFIARILPTLPVGDLPEGNTKDAQEYNGKVKARTAQQMYRTAKGVENRMHLINGVPVCFIHGSVDQNALLGAVEVAHKNTPLPEHDKKLLIYPGAGHDIFVRATHDAVQWMKERCHSPGVEVTSPNETFVPIEALIHASSVVLVAMTKLLEIFVLVLIHYWKKFHPYVQKGWSTTKKFFHFWK